MKVIGERMMYSDDIKGFDLLILKVCFALVIGLIFILPSIRLNAQGDRPLYKDSLASVNDRTRDLLERMTLQEKIAQLSHLHGYQIYSGQRLDNGKLADVVGDVSYGCVEGFTLTGPNCSRAMYMIQKYMLENTRLGIPVLTVTESLHGSVQDGSTIFPQSVGLGSTFNPRLAYQMTTAISQELRAQGMIQSLSPGMDVVRDLRWGRVEESFGEDPWLVGQMGIAEIKGYLDNGISPMLKPFGPGGAPLGGLNLASVESGERDVRDIYLKPYEMTIKNTKVMAVMSSYNSWNRIPNSSSKFLLTDILRDEWGFDGYVYSDWGAVEMLKTLHHTAQTDQEAAVQALTAGIDLEASSNCYQKLEELVANNKLDEKYIDQAVSRVLKVKFSLGLFEHPLPDTTNYKERVHTTEAIDLSRKIADEAIVLLKNEDRLLPLDPDKVGTIAVIGPNANQVQFGDYTWSRNNVNGITPLQGIKNLVGTRAQILFAEGCDLTTDNRKGFDAAVEAARESNLSILFVGSSSTSLARDYSNATSGEGYDLSSLELTGVQKELIQKVQALGKPVVVVLVTGKPFAIPWLKEYVPSIVVQWYGGERAGDAIADMLFGRTNPSGKLPFSFPKSVGHLPDYYNYLPTDKGFYHQHGAPNKPGRDYVFSSPGPLWAFGYGLSYTSFEYIGAKLSSTTLSPTDTLMVNVDVRNSGVMDGMEVVQLYVRDLVSSVVTPVKQLKAFAKPLIRAGETATVLLKVPIDELALYNQEMKRVVESGDFEIQIGSSSDQIAIRDTIQIITPVQSVDQMNDDRKNDLKKTSKDQKQNSSVKVITVSGEIRDVQATPIASVTVKTTRLGKKVNSDSSGHYSIKAYNNDTLIFEAHGYERKTLKVNNQKSVNVRLNYHQD